MISACRANVMHVGIADAKARTLTERHGDRLDPTSSSAFAIGEDHFAGLGSQAPTHDRQVARTQGRLVDEKLIRIDCALNNGLPETVGCSDEYHITKSRLGIECEHDATGAEVATHHELHTDR